MTREKEEDTFNPGIGLTSKRCSRCGGEAGGGLFLTRREGDAGFKNLKPGEGMHIGCYIDHCIELGIKKHENKDLLK